MRRAAGPGRRHRRAGEAMEMRADQRGGAQIAPTGPALALLGHSSLACLLS